LIQYYTDSDVLLLAVGGMIFVLEIWLVFEAVGALMGRRSKGDAGAMRGQ
jgi:hypothetical protein